jgi:hypothetical protein
MTLQPFLNYNLPKGWYLTSSPVITGNWEANSDNNRRQRRATQGPPTMLEIGA